MSLKALQDYTFTSKYARYKREEKRRETYRESTDRVRKMMHDKYIDKSPELHTLIDAAYDAMAKKKILGSQRALQFGGDPIFSHNARIYNCHKFSTKFVTSEGVRSFADFNHGDIIKVLTPFGNWKNATVKNYGKQTLNKITFKMGGNRTITEYATANHRWLLSNGTETTNLKVGDYLMNGPNIFSEFDFDSASPEEQLYWCYGFVYGDGTIVSNDYSMVRLCGHDSKYEKRFTNLGFKSSSSLSLKGDVMIYTGKYQKTTPNPKIDSPELIKAFVHGYLSADGRKNSNLTSDRQFMSIQSSDIDHINFIRECFPVAGVFITKERELTGEETNYGIRPYTISFNLIDHYSNSTSQKIKVVAIEEDSEESVWCLEVEDDKSFMLASGIPTGNCVSSYVDRLRFFQECMYLLLCGCGVGFSVQKHHIDNLPSLLDKKEGSSKYIIPDTIEGWSDAIGIAISSYFDHSEEFLAYKGKDVKFNFDSIRPKGSRISGGGKAPGPEPLKKAIKNIISILDKAIARGDKRLKPIEAYDIIMHASDAVISGGIRRSATICLFDPTDTEMAEAKTGNWFIENPQRGRSNNSALLIRGETSREEFSKLMKNVKEFGEPGFVWADSKDFIVNPCVEIGMYPVDLDTGESGWQGCNLSTINCAKINTEQDFLDAAKFAAIIGTLQAGFTSFPYLGKTSEKIFRRESLLGVSGTGWFENPNVCLNPDIQKKAAQEVVRINQIVADLIDIPRAARTTCVKPEGSSSCVLGTASGIHPHHAKRYIRRVQANKLESIYQHFKSVNPRACEESVWSANRTDEVISFCIEVPDGSKTKNKITAIELLQTVKSTQQNWVIPGTTPELCTAPWLVHNVSNTVNVKPEEWDEVEEFIYENREFFCGISLLPITGDKDYPQAPFATVYLPSEMISYYGDGVMFVSGLIEVALSLWEDNLWSACDSLLGMGIPPKGKAKLEWIERCNKFAQKYFDSNNKKLSYCMKDIYNYKLWTELNREYKEVDYTQVLEEEDDTQLEQALACSSGACEIF